MSFHSYTISIVCFISDDACRVQLPRQNDKTGFDYINASYIDVRLV